MKRILIPLVVAAGLIGPPAHAMSTDAIVAELRAEGYSDIEIQRTLLGRTRIVATSGNYDREIVFNPSTGVILRDLIRVRNGTGDNGSPRILSGSGPRDGSSRDESDGDEGGSGGSYDDNDDDDSSGSGGSGADSGGDSGGGSDDNDDDNDDDSDGEDD